MTEAIKAQTPRRAFISLIMKISGNVNADIGVGTRIPLKKIHTWNQETKAFVSARCIRRCIRERLFEKGEKIDPLQLIGPRGEEQLGDLGNPIECIDDDLFGFFVPVEPPRRRISPIKISHLIALRHTEIRTEFAARFPREFLPEYREGYPVPFEVEVGEWLGKLDVIISDRVGCFDEDELTEEMKTNLQKSGTKYNLPKDVRERRVKAFLEVLLWERWQFPRAAQSPSVPEFYYGMIALTDRFVPIFSYLNVTDEGALDLNRINNLKALYSPLIDKLFIIDYQRNFYESYRRVGEKLEGAQSEALTSANMQAIISDIVQYIVR